MAVWQDLGATRLAVLISGAGLIILFGFIFFWCLPFGQVTYSSQFEVIKTPVPVKEITHIPTPENVKGIYMTACTASGRKSRETFLNYFDQTVLNTLVIDVKDYTGTDSYTGSKAQTGLVGRGCRIADLPNFIEELHSKGIYVIARITVFQDPLYANAHPDLAIASKSKPGSVWRDKNGLAYIDPGAKPYWDYIFKIGKESYDIGFDELNFDYIRFPSDGDMSDVSYSWSLNKEKPEVLRGFFSYLHDQFQELHVPISADVFGLTTSAVGDMGIGQVLTEVLPYFDYVAPMVYPSHFASGFLGYTNPADHPYDVVRYSMDHAVSKAAIASTSPLKLRPWLQDFSVGATYTPAMIKDQIKATTDSGLTSWMLWNAGGIYHKEAVEEKN